MLDAQTGTLTSHNAAGSWGTHPPSTCYGQFGETERTACPGDSGGASRFFFRADYDEGDVPVG